MKSPQLRKIVIDEAIYLWKREHRHLSGCLSSPCSEVITIYLQGKKESPLRLYFKEDDNYLFGKNSKTEKWCLTGMGDGIAWLYVQSEQPGTDTLIINFNRPAVIKVLITYFLENGWCPESQTSSTEVLDALKYLDKIKNW